MSARRRPFRARAAHGPGVACGVLGVLGGAVILAGVVLMALVTFAPEFDRPGMHLRGFANLFYADNEANVWAWYSATLLAALAAAFAIHAYVRRGSGSPVVPYLALGALALYMSADEASALHERLSNLAPSVWTWGWLTIGIPLALVAGITAVTLARTMERSMRRRLIAAGTLFLLGAVVVEFVAGVTVVGAGSYEAGTQTALYMVLLGIEESLELAGVLVALWAALAALQVEHRPAGVQVSAAGVAPAS